MKYQPRNQRVTIWELQKNEEGETVLRHSEVVEREDFTEEHLKKILSFFDYQAKADPTFNKTKAIDSTFVIVDPSGQQEIVIDEPITDQPQDEEVAQVEPESSEIPEDIKAQYKELYGRNPRSDWSLEKVLEKINEKTESE
ncbi:MAG TPA: hypothetical protein PKN99_03045 [Cyclobacteriaceae bacterium]|nr:hypothetical protein [Cyclobacteriaceae bacterium]